MKNYILASIFLALYHSTVHAQYDFDDRNRNDMQGAWTMCATNGFSDGDCPSIYRKCWQPPMIYYRHGHLKTYCVKAPSFSGTQADGQKALDDAQKVRPL